MKLYEINAEILRLTDAIEFDEETGEILGDTDELFTQIQSLQMEKKSILEYLAKLVLNIRAEAAAAKPRNSLKHAATGLRKRRTAS